MLAGREMFDIKMKGKVDLTVVTTQKGGPSSASEDGSTLNPLLLKQIKKFSLRAPFAKCPRQHVLMNQRVLFLPGLRKTIQLFEK